MAGRPSTIGFRRLPDRVVDYRGMTNCFVRLENLAPDTAYYFVICDSEGVGQRLWFRTGPATAMPFTFIAGGDSRTNPEPAAAGAINLSLSCVRSSYFSAATTPGSGTPAEWKEWLQDWQLTISADGRIYPIIASHGNHENADLQMMSKVFDTPHPDQYYSFGFADDLMRIWVLNTELAYKAPAVVPAQQAWLEANLSQHADATWKLASYHRPMRPHTTTKAEGLKRIAAWAQLFYDQGIDLVVESDTHMVKRSYPLRPSEGEGSYESFVRDDQTGMVFIGEGSWGAPPKPADDDKPWTMACDSFHQFKWIQVQPDEMLIRTVKFEDVEKVEALTEETLFAEPENMVFWEPETGKNPAVAVQYNACELSRPLVPRVHASPAARYGHGVWMAKHGMKGRRRWATGTAMCGRRLWRATTNRNMPCSRPPSWWRIQQL